MNHYEALGIPRDASPTDVRSAFRRLARQYHPDAGDGSSSERFRRVHDAYQTLGDPELRSQYDRSLQTPRPVRIRRHPAVPVEPLTAPAWAAEPLRPCPDRQRSPDEMLAELMFLLFR